MNTELIDDVQRATIEGFTDSLNEYMPEGPHRDFYLWWLSPENPRQHESLQVLGIPQLARLTVKMLQGIIHGAEWQRILEHCVKLNVYLTYEVVSDNLAIGLARLLRGDTTREQRRGLLLAFNRAMGERLAGDRGGAGATELLASQRPAAQRISCFQQSLVPDKHRSLAQSYLATNPGGSIEDLEHAVWPQLVANIEACVGVARHVENFRVGPMVLHGLRDRYRAVNTLLDGEAMHLSRRIHVGTYAILVIPTLAYYMGVLAERVRPIDTLGRVLENGTLSEALFVAALLVRLLNDLGTPLVTQAERREEAIQSLRAKCARNPDLSFADLLVEGMEESGSMLTRIHKDILHGEFNICLYDIAERSGSDALSDFEQRLDHVAHTYLYHRDYLQRLLEFIDRRLGSEDLGRIIWRFVRFHEEIYTHAHTSDAGEYAV